MRDDEAAAAAGTLARAAGLAPVVEALAVSHGMSGDLVVRLGLADGRQVYAKLADPAGAASCAELAREIAALAWLDQRAGAPRLLWSGAAAGRPGMITEAVDGEALHALAPERAEAGALAALATLERLHALPSDGCPLDQRLAVKLAEAAARVAAGAVDAAALEAHNAGASPASLWRALLDRRPADEDLVVTHGDACWPNFILRPGGDAGIVDLGRFGLADRHQDLALFVRSARHNVPQPPIRALVAKHYQLARIDDEKLKFYEELDEFF